MKFNLSDIIVYEGVITRYGVIKDFINGGGVIRKATKEEINRYNKRP